MSGRRGRRRRLGPAHLDATDGHRDIRRRRWCRAPVRRRVGSGGARGQRGRPSPIGRSSVGAGAVGWGGGGPGAVGRCGGEREGRGVPPGRVVGSGSLGLRRRTPVHGATPLAAVDARGIGRAGDVTARRSDGRERPVGARPRRCRRRGRRSAPAGPHRAARTFGTASSGHACRGVTGTPRRCGRFRLGPRRSDADVRGDVGRGVRRRRHAPDARSVGALRRSRGRALGAGGLGVRTALRRADIWVDATDLGVRRGGRTGGSAPLVGRFGCGVGRRGGFGSGRWRLPRRWTGHRSRLLDRRRRPGGPRRHTRRGVRGLGRTRPGERRRAQARGLRPRPSPRLRVNGRPPRRGPARRGRGVWCGGPGGPSRLFPDGLGRGRWPGRRTSGRGGVAARLGLGGRPGDGAPGDVVLVGLETGAGPWHDRGRVSVPAAHDVVEIALHDPASSR